MQFCTFFINEIYFGIDVMEVQEVIRYQEMTPIPLTPMDIAGLINLRGQIITVIDLKCRLEMNKQLAVQEQGNFNIILRTNSELVSLLVDEMGDVVEVADGEFEPTPSTLKGKIRQMLDGAYKFENDFLLVLNAGKVLNNKSIM
jgi:purine-binding chemotaxis protein CheW